MKRNTNGVDPELVKMCGQFLEDHAEWLRKNKLTEEEFLKENPSYSQLLEYACSVIESAPPAPSAPTIEPL